MKKAKKKNEDTNLFFFFGKHSQLQMKKNKSGTEVEKIKKEFSK